MLRVRLSGFPHSETHGSMLAFSSPWLFADRCVLHRQLVPGHPPCALIRLVLPSCALLILKWIPSILRCGDVCGFCSRFAPGRKIRKETILCFRIVNDASQKSLLGAAKPLLRIDFEGLRPPSLPVTQRSIRYRSLFAQRRSLPLMPL